MKTILLYLAALPCLAQTIGPAQAPTVYRASQVGATLDCIINGSDANAGKKIGTLGTCTNNDALLNGILALASETNPVTLIVDGPTITAGIVGPATGYWTIDCLNTGNGFYVAPASNTHAIRNVPGKSTYNALATPGTPGQNIQIRNCYVNGNRGNGTTGNSNSGNPRQDAGGHWLFGIYLDNMIGVRLQNVISYNAPSFQFVLNSCAECELIGLKADENTPNATNQDGIHIDGPSSGIRIVDPWINSNDDPIALNASEGYAGAIDGVSISGEYCSTCLSALRTLSDEDGAGTNNPVTNVTFTNGSGYIKDSGLTSLGVFVIGYAHSNSSNLDLMGPIHISNSVFTTQSTATPFVNFADNVSVITLSNVTWLAPAGAQPFFTFNQAATISSLTCTTCKIYRNPTGHAAAYWGVVTANSIIKRLEIANSAIENAYNQSYSANSYWIDLQASGAITNLVVPPYDPLGGTLLNGAQYSRVTNLLGQSGMQWPITSISGCTSAAIGTGSLEGGWLINGTLTTGSCTPVLTFQIPAPHGYGCSVSDNATANIFRQTGSTTTTATFNGVAVSTDTLSGNCVPY